MSINHTAMQEESKRTTRLTICDEIVASPGHLDTLVSEDLQLTFHELCQYQFELESQNERLRHALAEQESARTRYFNLYDMAPVGVCILDPSGIIEDVNSTAALLLDMLKDQLVGQSILQYIHAEDRELYQRHHLKIRYGSGPLSCELRMRKENGSIFWTQLTSTVQKNGQAYEVQVVLNDMTERKFNEEVLRQSERDAQEAKNLLKLVIDTIPVCLFWKDIQSTYLGCNMLFARDAGYETPEEVVGLDDYRMTWWEQAEIYREDDVAVINAGTPKLRYEEIQTMADGRQRWLSISKVPLRDVNGQVIGVLGAYEDITRQKQMESELPRAEKLESLALLAGGVIHEFNTILMAIKGNLSQVTAQLPPTHAALGRMAAVASSLVNAEELLQGFLPAATDSLPDKHSFAVANLLGTYCRLTLSRTRSTYTCALANDLWRVEADICQIGQALASILAYVGEAAPKQSVILISCENRVVGPADSLPMNSGNYVHVMIKVKESVIPEDHVGRMFDPTLTSQERGGRRGLAWAYTSITRNGGHLAVASSSGEGTTFTLYLPASMPAAPIETGEDALTSGRGRILVMDDDKLICNLLGTMLQQLGYASEIVLEGKGAIAKYTAAKQAGVPFDAVIMDLIIVGGMGGMETMEKLLLFDPHVKVIVSSGYNNNSIKQEYRQYGFSDVIEKPYCFSQVSKTMQRVLTFHNACGDDCIA